ncbi:thioesterase domain-containing protein [Streptomyces sp. A0642]|uniref:thioesterase II family protein n=1 Tax=Streptomyces sp. A0642 TaxID=2563100 RepID=UPI001F0E2F65|nr:thioesterase domain-containing protein [Streptomyces sp. A0642]
MNVRPTGELTQEVRHMCEEPPVRLHCFAHAGAGVSAFYNWPADLGPEVEALPRLLPGRDARRREPRATGREALLADLMESFARAPDAPYVLYGHSLGAMVAYTVTRALHEAGLPGPALLALGACPPPDAPSLLSDAAWGPEDELLELLRETGTLPQGARPGGLWYRAVLPVLRDDLSLAHELRINAHEPVVGPPLSVPVLILSGAQDPLAPPDVMAGWQAWSTGPAVTRTVPGDHFFVRGHELPRLLGRACRVLRRTRPARAMAAAGS